MLGQIDFIAMLIFLVVYPDTNKGIQTVTNFSSLSRITTLTLL
jgi:hypothetical protein